MSTEPHDPAFDEQLEAALEASCAALVELQLVRSLAGEDAELVATSTAAIAALRGAIAELRAAQVGSSHPLSQGFVLGCESESVEPDDPAPHMTDALQRLGRLLGTIRRRIVDASGRHDRELLERSTLALPTVAGARWQTRETALARIAHPPAWDAAGGSAGGERGGITGHLGGGRPRQA
jgi:hypothetical protein